MFESLSRGWSLTKSSFKVLSLDKEILALPLMAGALMVAAVIGIGYGAFGILTDGSVGTLLLVFGTYVLVYFISIFFNAAVIEMATIRFNGGDPVLKDGLSKAWSKAGRILQWAVVAATVGLIFRILRDQAKDSFIAQIFLGLLEGAWNLVTFFAVPIAIYQDVGPLDAIKGSTRLMRRTWGESVGGIFTTSILFFVLGLLGAIPIAILLFVTGGPVWLLLTVGAITVVYWIALAAVNSAVDGILVAGLYKYANEGRLPAVLEQNGVQAESLTW